MRNLGQQLGTLDHTMLNALVSPGPVIRHLEFQMLHSVDLETCDWRKKRGLSLIMPPTSSKSAAIQAIFFMRKVSGFPLRSSSSSLLEVAFPDRI